MGDENPKYRVEIAKTGRSTCKTSKQKIEVGELRFGSFADVMGHGSYQWRKPGHITARLAKNAESKVGRWEDVGGFAELTPAQQRQFLEAMDAALKSTGKGKAKAKAGRKTAKCESEENRMDDLGEDTCTDESDAQDDGEGDAIVPLLCKLDIPRHSSEKYGAALAEAGFDCVPALLTLGEPDLERFGVLLGHRRLILRYISDKNQKRPGGILESCAKHPRSSTSATEALSRSDSQQFADDTGLELHEARRLLRESQAAAAVAAARR